MTKFVPATQHTDAILRPPCPKCGAPRMMLSRIEPDSPGKERRTFECPSCGNEMTEIAQFK